ncbi:hypothetical protein C2845_PM17G14060 [Panicum miliaceum]|uniref:At1g61320/AtMIF1 LRR domain-containing protein n=1 Tax=Panicum miliaceum TaxID=4540 RepID=A0A3L6Q4V0_PANMI|nr:hypothetical protein C2845_PM17G14060 [Panicum miliaceum]
MGSDSGAAPAGDRLSGLEDAVLGHVLSFLPADEAARAAAFSRRWRHVFAHVHTVALEEPDPPIPDYDGNWSPGYSVPVDRNAGVPAPPTANRVSAALFGRLGGAPLRALRVGFHAFSGLNAGLVDAWLSYAMGQAGEELHVDLRLRRAPVCGRRYSLRRRDGGAEDTDDEDGGGQAPAIDEWAPFPWVYDPRGGDEESDDEGDSQDDDPASPKSETAAAEDATPTPYENEYVAPRSLFSCAAPRSLRIGPCRLDLPAAVALPSLGTLHLTQVTGAVQRLVSAFPRLADLTLEACDQLAALDVPPGARLRRLALRCCHDLAAVAADSSELRAFEYRGAVPAPSFLTLRGGGRIASCKLDFCGAEATDPPELARLAGFLQLFVRAERLHLTSARLGCGAALAFPAFPALRHLELTGMVPDDDATSAVATVTTILERVPSLETLTLFFLPEPEDLEESEDLDVDDEELLDGHKLRYDRHAPLAVPDAEIPPCLRETTREINLVHYEGGLAQRTLAKFLLRNASVVGEVCGEFAQGPLWIQTRLMEEIKGWVVNKSANMMFF